MPSPTSPATPSRRGERCSSPPVDDNPSLLKAPASAVTPSRSGATNTAAPRIGSLSPSRPQRPPPYPPRKNSLFNGLLDRAERRRPPREPEPHHFLPRDCGDDHLRQSFEKSVVQDGLTVSALFQIRTREPSRKKGQKAKGKRGRVRGRSGAGSVSLRDGPYALADVPGRAMDGEPVDFEEEGDRGVDDMGSLEIGKRRVGRPLRSFDDDKAILVKKRSHSSGVDGAGGVLVIEKGRRGMRGRDEDNAWEIKKDSYESEPDVEDEDDLLGIEKAPRDPDISTRRVLRRRKTRSSMSDEDDDDLTMKRPRRSTVQKNTQRPIPKRTQKTPQRAMPKATQKAIHKTQHKTTKKTSTKRKRSRSPSPYQIEDDESEYLPDVIDLEPDHAEEDSLVLKDLHELSDDHDLPEATDVPKEPKKSSRRRSLSQPTSSSSPKGSGSNTYDTVIDVDEKSSADKIDDKAEPFPLQCSEETLDAVLGSPPKDFRKKTSREAIPSSMGDGVPPEDRREEFSSLRFPMRPDAKSLKAAKQVAENDDLYMHIPKPIPIVFKSRKAPFRQVTSNLPRPPVEIVSSEEDQVSGSMDIKPNLKENTKAKGKIAGHGDATEDVIEVTVLKLSPKRQKEQKKRALEKQVAERKHPRSKRVKMGALFPPLLPKVGPIRKATAALDSKAKSCGRTISKSSGIGWKNGISSSAPLFPIAQKSTAASSAESNVEGERCPDSYESQTAATKPTRDIFSSANASAAYKRAGIRKSIGPGMVRRGGEMSPEGGILGEIEEVDIEVCEAMRVNKNAPVEAGPHSPAKTKGAKLRSAKKSQSVASKLRAHAGRSEFIDLSVDDMVESFGVRRGWSKGCGGARRSNSVINVVSDDDDVVEVNSRVELDTVARRAEKKEAGKNIFPCRTQ